jgi:EAL domain-containing protein (putative c-di-GMP-specific phosphodiesterase class I)
VLRRACAVAARWPADCKLAVNISPAQLRHRDLIDTVRAALDQSGLPAWRLELEVTESVVIQDTEDALATLSQLKAMGVSLALDDFGTGYSSMSALVRFPFDRVKIDRSFIAGLGRRNDCGAIVRAVTGLCRSLGLATTAEGIETPQQLALVNAEGCTEVQGFLLGRPASADEIGVDVVPNVAEHLAA